MNIPTFVTKEQSIGKKIKSFRETSYNSYMAIEFEDNTVLMLYSQGTYENDTEICQIEKNPRMDIEFVGTLKNMELVSEEDYKEFAEQEDEKHKRNAERRRFKQYQDLKKEFGSTDS